MLAEDQQGVGFIKKQTCWLTNSPEMAECISGKCKGGHRHVHLINGRARAAQTYPPKLVSILKGIRLFPASTWLWMFVQEKSSMVVLFHVTFDGNL